MKVVKETKIPTTKQMSSMAFNLREKFKCHTQIEVSVDAYDLDPYLYGGEYFKPEVKYRIYTANTYDGESIRHFNSWESLLDFYKLMISS